MREAAARRSPPRRRRSRTACRPTWPRPAFGSRRSRSCSARSPRSPPRRAQCARRRTRPSPRARAGSPRRSARVRRSGVSATALGALGLRRPRSWNVSSFRRWPTREAASRAYAAHTPTSSIATSADHTRSCQAKPHGGRVSHTWPRRASRRESGSARSARLFSGARSRRGGAGGQELAERPFRCRPQETRRPRFPASPSMGGAGLEPAATCV